MAILTPERIFAVMLVIGLPVLLWLGLRLMPGGATGRLARPRRVQVAEVTALSPADRALILRVDDREFLVLKMRGAAPVLTPLAAPVPVQTGATA